jgi:hypothetical protein
MGVIDQAMHKVQDIYNFVREYDVDWANHVLNQHNISKSVQTNLERWVSSSTPMMGTALPVHMRTLMLSETEAKTHAEYRRAEADALSQAASRGLTLPSGAAFGMAQMGRLAMAEAAASQLTGIAIKGFELEQKWLEFVQNMGFEFMKFHTATAQKYAEILYTINKDVLFWAADLLKAWIGAYDQYIRVYEAQWRGVQSAVEVYKAKVDAETAKIQIFKAKIDAEVAKTSMGRAVADLCNATATYNESLVKVFQGKAQIELKKAELSMFGLEIFNAQVKRFAAEIQAFSAEVEGYKGRMEGELALVKSYESEVKGFEVEVAAWKAQTDAILAKNKGEIDRVMADLEGQKATVHGETVMIEAKGKANALEVDRYRAEWGAVAEELRIEVEYWKTTADYMIRAFTAELNGVLEAGRQNLMAWQTQLQQAVAAGQGMVQAAGVAGQVASSAMSGVTSFAGTLVQAATE